MRILHLVGALALTTAAAGAALAQDAPAATDPAATPPAAATTTTAAGDTAAGFGQAGQIAIMTALDDSSLNLHTDLSFIHSTQSMGGGSTNLFTLAPSLHYFVMPNVSVSGTLAFATGSVSAGATSIDVTGFGLLVGGGYNLHLTPLLSAWAQLQIGYLHQSASAGGVSASGYTIPLIVQIPLLFHLAEHFFVGAGPVFRTELASKMEDMDQPKSTDIGLTAVIGGYFGM